MNDPKDLVAPLRWLGHASIVVAGSRIVYVDPWEIEDAGKADLVLITHDHYDHCSPPDLARIRKEGTVVAAPPGCADTLGCPVREVAPGERFEAAGVAVEAVHAYNPAKKFHPRAAAHLGYVFTVDGVRYYHAGDTDRIPEMDAIRADVAILPVGGTYTMDAAEAARVAETVQARVAVPIHWGKIVGSEKDAETFRDRCRVPVVILQPPRR